VTSELVLARRTILYTDVTNRSLLMKLITIYRAKNFRHLQVLETLLIPCIRDKVHVFLSQKNVSHIYNIVPGKGTRFLSE
jgi:hypothetical protein